MALIEQDATKSRASTQTLPEPDYKAEAEELRLKLREDELLRNSSRLHPQRTMWDTIVSGAGAVVAVALIVIGAAAVYGGTSAETTCRIGSPRKRSCSHRWTR